MWKAAKENIRASAVAIAGGSVVGISLAFVAEYLLGAPHVLSVTCGGTVAGAIAYVIGEWRDQRP